MTKLVLMRHATAVAHSPSDWSRPLSAVGREQAHEAGEWLRANGLEPDAAVVSSSLRTTQTWDCLGLSLRHSPTDAAYNASALELSALVRQCPADAQVIVLVAHNPGVSDLADVCGHPGHLSPGSAVLVSWQGSPSEFTKAQVVVEDAFAPQ